MPVSSHIPKINQLKNIGVERRNMARTEEKKQSPTKLLQKNVTFSSIRKIAGDDYQEEEFSLPKYEQEKFNEFNELLNESVTWKLIKSFTKFNVEVRRADRSKNGVPFT